MRQPGALHLEPIFMARNKKTLKNGFSRIVIQDLKLSARLGISEQERRKPQKIFCSIVIEFPSPPKAQITDKAQDSVCYEKICKALQNQVKGKKFHLLEKMSCDLLSFLQTEHPKLRISLALRKQNAPVKKFCKAVHYTLGPDPKDFVKRL